MSAKKLLILGGTGEAAQLARRVVDVFQGQLECIVSYSGVTGHQPDLPCKVHVGGFGGASGVIQYLEQEKVTHLVDATHPFAEKISQHAYIAANACKIPLVFFQRPPWQPHPGDRWLEVDNMEQALEQVAKLEAKTFLTIGIKELSRFDGLGNVPFLVRLVNETKEALPLAKYESVVSHPPFDVEGEKNLMREHGIRLLVTKNSGGEQTEAKIIAARDEKIAVLMINRPPREPGEYVSNVEDVIKWLSTHGALAQ